MTKGYKLPVILAVRVITLKKGDTLKTLNVKHLDRNVSPALLSTCCLSRL